MTSPEGPRPPVGTLRVGRYLLREVIGVGSFATVHRAVDERLDDVVVVKILAENHSLNPEVRQRFIAEGRALRRIGSPHVVTVHDIGESERQQPYLVLELADRGTLADRVALLRKRGWSADRDDVLTVARQLAGALRAVHAGRLVHRDLSPTNVLLATSLETPAGGTGDGGAVAGGGDAVVGADERLVVADLGMCKDLAVSSGLTVAGGTMGYRPPEMDGGPAVIDIRADLWSLSALVRWLCEGADLPDTVRDVLDRGQADDPEHRQPDVTTWLAEMERALGPADPEPAQRSRQARVEPPGGRSRRQVTPRAGWSLAAVALAALLLGTAGGWVLRGPGDPPSATASARLEIEVPEEVQVGDPVTLTVRHLGVDSWVWLLPTGEHVVDAETVTLTPSGPGPATVSVRAVDGTGRDLQHVLEFRVSEP